MFLFKEQKFNKDFRLFCSTATKQLASHFLQEIYQLVDRRNQYVFDSELERSYYKEVEFYEYFEEHHHINIQDWVELYSKVDVTHFTETIQTVAYGQIVPLSQYLRLEAQSAGYQIGSCIWVLSLLDASENTIERVGVINSISFSENRHPLQFDLERLKKQNIDHLILGEIASPIYNFQLGFTEQFQHFENTVSTERTRCTSSSSLSINSAAQIGWTNSAAADF